MLGFASDGVFVDSGPDAVEPDAAEPDEAALEDELDVFVVSAEAVPHPNPITAPIPSAAANPPMRPMYADAPMCRLNSDRDHCQCDVLA